MPAVAKRPNLINGLITPDGQEPRHYERTATQLMVVEMEPSLNTPGAGNEVAGLLDDDDCPRTADFGPHRSCSGQIKSLVGRTVRKLRKNWENKEGWSVNSEGTTARQGYNPI